MKRGGYLTRKVVLPRTQVRTCKHCDGSIVWLTSRAGKRYPAEVLVEPQDHDNVIASGLHRCTFAAVAAKQALATAIYLSEIESCDECHRSFPRGNLIKVEECWDGPYYMACLDCAPAWVSDLARNWARRFVPIAAKGG